ncbi:CapA family protein [Modestobacter sp. URMC 112]
MKLRWVVVSAILLIVSAATAVLSTRSGEVTGSRASTHELVARVLDEDGRPLSRTEVRLSTGVSMTTDADGRGRAPLLDGPSLITATADGHLPRTQAVEPGTPTEFRLTSDPGATVSVRFGGDVMFGRRFYDADDDGDRSDGLLREGASSAEHAALLEQVRPLLEEADLTVVNLETPLADDPWVDPTRPRPADFHPTKEFVFASSPASVQALQDSGVDVVSLGNNHVFDALARGLDATLTALDDAGLPRFGAGRTVDEAWAPAVLERKGQRLAFLGCTTITGTEHAIPYVAGAAQGGAAQCSAERLEDEVRRARTAADTVVVMIHGGEEYEVRQTELVRRLSAVATAAGATVVVNGHPHVVGGVSIDGGAVVAESMGNLLFDQTVWPTFLSYLLRVDVRAGRPVMATVDPLFIEGYVPRPTVGRLADAAARRATGLTSGPHGLLQPPGAVFTSGDPPSADTVRRDVGAGTVARLAPGWWLEDPGTAAGRARVRVGEDLLWTGSFEDMDTDPGTRGAHGWSLSPTATVTSTAACNGTAGVELTRSPVSRLDVVATPAHRQLVTPGTELSLLADVRDASAGAALELRWYGDTRGESTSAVSVPIPAGEYGNGSCRLVRIDATVPEGIVAVQPMLRLPPPGDVQFGAHVAVDDVRLVAWAGLGEYGRRFDVLEAREDATVSFTDDAGSGGEPLTGHFGG